MVAEHPAPDHALPGQWADPPGYPQERQAAGYQPALRGRGSANSGRRAARWLVVAGPGHRDRRHHPVHPRRDRAGADLSSARSSDVGRLFGDRASSTGRAPTRRSSTPPISCPPATSWRSRPSLSPADDLSGHLPAMEGRDSLESSSAASRSSPSMLGSRAPLPWPVILLRSAIWVLPGALGVLVVFTVIDALFPLWNRSGRRCMICPHSGRLLR